MKSISALRFIRSASSLVLAVLLLASGAWASPTTPEQAKNVVLNWIGKDALPLGAPLGRQIKEVQTFPDAAGNPAYYVVYLNPAGMVFLPADDLVEPIIGYLPDGFYDPSPNNPLGALVSNDIPGRVLQARQVEAKGLEGLAPHTPQAKARRKWDWLQSPTSGLEGLESGLPIISDVRVASFVSSRWSQTNSGGLACYNYYTPPYAAGSTSNYPSGCVATAMSQLMRFWSHPTAAVGTGGYTITVDGVGQTAYLRGGNGSGSAYVWSDMVLVPASGATTTQRQAIGNLTYDAGLSVNMDYAADASGADTLQAADAFVSTFGYSNGKKGYNSDSNLPDSNRNNMVNPNLHAGYPILFGITGAVGHAIVCDGYGYNSATMYHHLNLGWAGSGDAWYNLPTIDTSQRTFTTVHKCVYNVYTSGSGEIIAGRVTEANGTTAVSGVTVTATRSGGGTYNALAATDLHGIYAIPKVPSSSSYTVSASKTGYTFTPQSVTTGTSTNNSTTTGNKWGIDFVAVGGPALNLNQALDNVKVSPPTAMPTGSRKPLPIFTAVAPPRAATFLIRPLRARIPLPACTPPWWDRGGCRSTGRSPAKKAMITSICILMGRIRIGYLARWTGTREPIASPPVSTPSPGNTARTILLARALTAAGWTRWSITAAVQDPRYMSCSC